MYNPFSLSDKTILITGASSGIGKSIAQECAKSGAKVIITGRNPARLQESLDSLTGEGHIKIEADIASEEGMEFLVNNVPKIEGIVHSAGIANPKPFQFLNRKELEDVMQINFLSPVLITKELIKKKSISKGSSIVFISSISGVVCSFMGGSSYSASKGAINGIVKGMALELASKKIRVNSVTPGMVDTGIFDGSAISEADLNEDKKKYPLGRYGKPEDVAFAVIYLLSDASSWTTGTGLLLDGGFTLI